MRRLIARLILTAAVIWPFGHYAISRITGASSWDLFSLGMYATPPLDPSLRIHARIDGEEVLLGPDNLPVDSREVLNAVEWRWVIGDIEKGRGLSKSILAAEPAFDSVRIQWLEQRLDRRTARIVIREEEVVTGR